MSKKVGAPKNNTNAEVWDIGKTTKLFADSLLLSVGDEYDFIGEIARDLGTYRDIYTYLVGKFPQFEKDYKAILSNLEANCFSHSKKGKIKEATAIVNLKSNYDWKDKHELTGANNTPLYPQVDPFKQIRENADIDDPNS